MYNVDIQYMRIVLYIYFTHYTIINRLIVIRITSLSINRHLSLLSPADLDTFLIYQHLLLHDLPVYNTPCALLQHDVTRVPACSSSSSYHTSTTTNSSSNMSNNSNSSSNSSSNNNINILLSSWYTHTLPSPSSSTEMGHNSDPPGNTIINNVVADLIHNTYTHTTPSSTTRHNSDPSTTISYTRTSSYTLPTDLIHLKYRNLLVTREIQCTYDNIIRYMLYIITTSTTPTIRAKMLKCLYMYMYNNSNYMSYNHIQRVIIMTGEDVAISVREEAVKLIGLYLTSANSTSGAVTTGMYI